MVLIAIDKYSRRILGYLCKNDEALAYCCGDCEVEFTTSTELEEHMVGHDEKRAENIEPILQVADEKLPDDDKPLNEIEVESKQLSSVEQENLLKIKYQVI